MATETRKQEILNSFYETLNITPDALTVWFECTSRPVWEATKVSTHPCITCVHCGQKHPGIPITEEEKAKRATTQGQFDVLTKYEIYLVRNKTLPRIAFAVGDAEVDVMFRNAFAFDEVTGLTRETLMQWYLCERKNKYATFEEAEIKLANGNYADKTHPYLCTKGDHFHLGRAVGSSGRRGSSLEHARNAYRNYEKNGNLSVLNLKSA